MGKWGFIILFCLLWHVYLKVFVLKSLKNKVTKKRTERCFSFFSTHVPLKAESAKKQKTKKQQQKKQRTQSQTDWVWTEPISLCTEQKLNSKTRRLSSNSAKEGSGVSSEPRLGRYRGPLPSPNFTRRRGLPGTYLPIWSMRPSAHTPIPQVYWNTPDYQITSMK